MMHNTGFKSGSAETAMGALSVEGPQPVWMTLNEARERAFTGEVVFEVDPEVLAYFDHGVVYYAERASDVSLGRRLVEAGVLESGQLERGTVRIGEIEHLGRLFDRDVTVDRDAVLVLTETATEDLIAGLANREVASVRVTAYRHHPSGVHRWFATPVDGAATGRPASDVTQMNASAVEDLSNVSFGMESDELTIEWDEPLDLLDTNGASIVFDAEADTDIDADALVMDLEEVVAIEPFEVVEDDDLEVELVHEDPIAELVQLAALAEMEAAAEVADLDDVDDVADLDSLDDVEEMDGAEMELADALVAIDEDRHAVADTDDVDQTDETFDFAVVWPDGSEVATDESTELDPAATTVDAEQPVEPVSNPTEVRFEMPSLSVDAPVEPSDDLDIGAEGHDEVSDDVADAVRRAIAALESATIENPVVVADAPAATPVASAPSAFAPPTMDMRAEVIYGQIEAEMEAEAAELAAAELSVEPVESPADVAEPTTQEAGVASVVFVDDESESGGDERTSALKRLIGSLRRKDR